MNCFCTSQTNANGDNCCRANDLCSFNGNLDDVVSTPIYVQSVYDAVRFNLQGMTTVQSLKFTPAIPCGCTISRITDIRCKKVFNPCQVNDCDNLTLDMETGISGACFLNDSGSVIETIGPDGIPSEQILFAESGECDDDCAGIPIFGTQNVKIWGNIIIYLDLAVCDSCGRESCITVCAEVNIAKPTCPLVLTNFFELCMPNSANSAFMPRLTGLANAGFTCRLATNSLSRDLCIDNNGEITANFIITVCVTVEKKITVPVQLCVLSTGFSEAPLQDNASTVMNCPGLFPDRTDSSSAAFSSQAMSNCCPESSGCDSCGTQLADDGGCGCSDYPPTIHR